MKQIIRIMLLLVSFLYIPCVYADEGQTYIASKKVQIDYELIPIMNNEEVTYQLKLIKKSYPKGSISFNPISTTNVSGQEVLV